MSEKRSGPKDRENTTEHAVAQAVEMTKKGILRMVFSLPRGTDPLAQAPEISAPTPAVMSPEAAALKAEIVDLPPRALISRPNRPPQ